MQDEVDRLKTQLGEYSRKLIDFADEIIAWKEASGLACGGDPDGVTPAKAKAFWGAEAKRIEAFQAQDIERQADIVALRHDLEVAEHERNEAQKELAEWKRAHSPPICNPPEATGEYVDVMGEMTIPFTVQMPVELCPAVVYCNVGDQNVEIESDDRTCPEKDSTRLTNNSVNSGSCNTGELHEKREQS